MVEDADWPEVYAPAEDSHLLARTAADRVDADDLVLDVGTGSGYVAAHVRAETGATVVGSDRNPHACRAARDRGVASVRADLTGAFRGGTFDAVLFNPPYLPTPPARQRDDWLERALSGGETGRRIIAPFLATVRRVLAPDGRTLLLVSTLTGVEAVESLAVEGGLRSERVGEESFPFETLLVLELSFEE